MNDFLFLTRSLREYGLILKHHGMVYIVVVLPECPPVKYKSLLHPPHGSIYKATRHFQDLLKVEDPIVVAMARERLFLCSWIEAQYRPQVSVKRRKTSETQEVAEHVLKVLRATFKSMSDKIKNAATRDTDAALMVKAWYS